MAATRNTFLMAEILKKAGFGIHFPPDGTFGRAFLKVRTLTLSEVETALDAEGIHEFMRDLRQDSIGGVWFRAAE